MRIKPWWLPAGRTGLRYQDQEGRKQEGSRRRWAWRFDAGKRKELLFFLLGFPGVSAVKKKKKNPHAMQETRVRSWVGKIPWRRKWQPTPALLPGESPGTEEPGGRQSMGLQRVGHD